MPKSLNKQQWKFTVVYLLWVVLTIWFLREIFSPPQPKELSYSDFLGEVKAGHLQDVRITERQLIGTLKKDVVKNQKGPQNLQIQCTRIPGLDAGPLVQELQAQGVKFSGTIPTESWWTGFLISWGPLLLLFVIYWVAMSRMQKGGGPLSFGRNRAKIHDESSRLDTSFNDVAGVDEAKGELSEIIDFLKTPQKYQKLGGRIPKGVLLVGPPGTGKTLLARAVAGEAGVPFFSISGSEFVEMFVGVGAARVRDLFQQAAAKAPCIVFIDELDALGTSRNAGFMGGHDEREQTLNPLLAEMDGFDARAGLIIMGATNRPEILDPALLRPGRFDRQVLVDRPDKRGRERILQIHAREVKLAPDVDLRSIAARTPGFAGADLANVVNEAALLAARRNKPAVGRAEFEEAVERVVAGLEKKSRRINEREKEIVAFHESGHALVSWMLPCADRVTKVSIIPRGLGALGYTLQLPLDDRYLLTRSELRDRMAGLMGGRVAEEEIFGEPSTGAANDLQQATGLARLMVREYGMSALGPLALVEERGPTFLGVKVPETRPYSDRTALEVDREVRAIVLEAERRAREVLRGHLDKLHALAARLLSAEVVEEEELLRLLGPKAARAAVFGTLGGSDPAERPSVPAATASAGSTGWPEPRAVARPLEGDGGAAEPG